MLQYNVSISVLSGSGKTSLLDVLAGRNDGGSVEGEMFLNGVSWTRQMVRSCSAYVRQDDRLLAHLTVKETLMFVAQLKLPSSFQKEEIENRVKYLENQRHAYIKHRDKTYLLTANRNRYWKPGIYIHIYNELISYQHRL